MCFFHNHTSRRYLFFSFSRSNDRRVSFRLEHFSNIWNFLFVSDTALFRRFHLSPLCTVIKLFSHPLFLGTARSRVVPRFNWRVTSGLTYETHLRCCISVGNIDEPRTQVKSAIRTFFLYPPIRDMLLYVLQRLPFTPSLANLKKQPYHRLPFAPLILPIFSTV